MKMLECLVYLNFISVWIPRYKKRLEIIIYIVRLIEASVEGSMVRDSIPVPFRVCFVPSFLFIWHFRWNFAIHASPTCYKGWLKWRIYQGEGKEPRAPSPRWTSFLPMENMAPSRPPFTPSGKRVTLPLSQLRPTPTSEGVGWDGGRSPGTGEGPDGTPFNTFNTEKSRKLWFSIYYVLRFFR